ncbi:MAG TPA: DUF177 domain-containing protein [Gemmatimonadales bacterium]|nr:DUF177 domain-containing protein [Gemmatimonadales bacterium]
MLSIDVRQIGSAGVATDGTLDPADPAFDGLLAPFMAPVEVAGTLRLTEGGDYLWRAHVRATLGGECRRCLAPVEQVVEDDFDVIFSADPDLQEDPSVYPVPAHATSIDVAWAVREEVTLRASAFLLCQDACQGLCPQCGADLNAGPCRCAAPGLTN